MGYDMFGSFANEKIVIFSLLTVMLCAIISACSNVAEDEGIWADAVYTENVELGDGSKELVLGVTAEDKTVEITINSDEKTVGDALTEHGIITGEKGPYGLYVKTVNGMLADYDINKTYWSFSKDGEALMQGVDAIAVEDGGHYGFTCTK